MKRFIKKSVRATLQEVLHLVPNPKITSVFSQCFFNKLDGSYQGKVELVVYDRVEALWDRRYFWPRRPTSVDL